MHSSGLQGENIGLDITLIKEVYALSADSLIRRKFSACKHPYSKR